MSRDVLNMREAEVVALRRAKDQLYGLLESVVDELSPEGWEDLGWRLQEEIMAAIKEYAPAKKETAA